MKKIILTMFALLSLCLTGCSNQKVNINGMNVDYERISYIESNNYGVIEDDNIILYVTVNSGSYTPSVEKLKIEKETLIAEVELRTKGQYVTWDMAYWKITIDSDEKYVSNIDSINMYVERK